ncbi:MAG: hypothetical protein WCQ32_00815 [bacterium]
MENEYKNDGVNEISKTKTNWKFLGIMLVILIVQMVGIFFSGVLMFINGIDTFSLGLFIGGFIVATGVILLPLPFWITAKKQNKGSIFTINILISGIVCIELVFVLISSIIGGIHNHYQQKAFQAQLTQETARDKTEYQKIISGPQTVLIKGWKDNNSGTNLLETNLDFYILLNTSFTPAIIDYINKNIVGKQFDLIVPEYAPGEISNSGSNEYPIWSCRCDLGQNGQGFESILSKIYRNTQPQFNSSNQIISEQKATYSPGDEYVDKFIHGTFKILKTNQVFDYKSAYGTNPVGSIADYNQYAVSDCITKNCKIVYFIDNTYSNVGPANTLAVFNDIDNPAIGKVVDTTFYSDVKKVAKFSTPYKPEDKVVYTISYTQGVKQGQVTYTDNLCTGTKGGGFSCHEPSLYKNAFAIFSHTDSQEEYQSMNFTGKIIETELTSYQYATQPDTGEQFPLVKR